MPGAISWWASWNPSNGASADSTFQTHSPNDAYTGQRAKLKVLSDADVCGRGDGETLAFSRAAGEVL